MKSSTYAASAGCSYVVIRSNCLKLQQLHQKLDLYLNRTKQENLFELDFDFVNKHNEDFGSWKQMQHVVFGG